VSSVKVALVQMDVVLGRPAENRHRATEFVREAAAQSDLVVLPEMWSTGYVLDELSGNLADRDGEPLGAFLSDLAHQCGIYLAGSRAVERSGKVYNLATVHGPDGRLVAEYAKIHLVPMMEEPVYLTPGDRLAMADLDGLRSGLAVCYDLRFCEQFRSLALRGAELMIVPAEWPAARLPHWRTLLMARAIENQCFMLGCNRIGSDGKNEFAGHTMVVDPWGNVLVEGDEEESILYAVIDPAQVAEVRTRIPVFRDRRPDVYGLSE
jgi:predicted amidohydrolase